MTLVEWIVERQREAGITSDSRYARDVLGVSKATYSQVRNGVQPLSARFLVRVLAAYPERCQEILALYRADQG